MKGTLPRGTTPTFTLTFDGDLTEMAHTYVTFTQGDYSLTKSDDDLHITTDGEQTLIDISLTQEETLMFSAGSVEVQANFTTATGGRMASEIAKCILSKQLLAKVVE